LKLEGERARIAWFVSSSPSFLGPLPLRLSPGHAIVEAGHRQPSDQEQLSRGVFDVFCSCPMLRRPWQPEAFPMREGTVEQQEPASAIEQITKGSEVSKRRRFDFRHQG
jgi:hypothetical protein